MVSTPSTTQPPDAGLTLNTAAIVGIVISLVVIITAASGILTGLVWRKKNHTPPESDDSSAPTYEQVLSPTHTRIILKKNEAYGNHAVIGYY